MNTNKILTFKNGDYTLPSEIFTSPKWCIKSLQDNKEKLNKVKSLLDAFPLKEWTKHTKRRSAASKFIYTVKQIVDNDLITIAWCKFYEILNHFEIIPKDAFVKNSLFSVHLCEIPGAFISALHHFLTNNEYEINWDWCANTLNPYYEGNSSGEMIADDRLLRYTFQKWHFGEDFSGDIKKYYNYVNLINQIRVRQNIFLVTADGSIDCIPDPGNQEKTVEFLHYCETITALSVLEKNGTFVLKIFTIFEDTTVCLLYLLNCVFGQVSLFKPVSSKSGNSEIYVICLNYVGLDCLENIWQDLLEPFKNGGYNANVSLFDLDLISKSFQNEINRFSTFLMERQIETIKGNIFHFRNMDHNETKRIDRLQKSVSQICLKKLNIQPLPYNLNFFRKYGIEMDCFPRKVTHFQFGQMYTLKYDTKLMFNFDSISFDFRYGKVLKTLKCSHFCSDNLLTKCFYDKNLGNKMQGSLYQLVLKKLEANQTVVTNDIRSYKNYNEFQRDVFRNVYESNKNCLVFGKVPFLTNFLAGLLLILLYCCENVYVDKRGWLILDNLNNKRVKYYLDEVNKKYREISISKYFESDLLQLILPTFVCNDDYFSFLFNWNNKVLSKL